MNDITIKTVEPILIAAIHKEIGKGDFQAASLMWTDVNEFIRRNNLPQAIPCMSLFHGSTWDWDKTNNWDVEVAEPITKSVPGDDLVKVYSLPLTEKMACIVHNGPLRTIGKSYKAISQWIAQNGYSINGPVREIYHVGEWATQNEEEYVTELQFPL